jgi:P4 family phage/plasmid primase-like protien
VLRFDDPLTNEVMVEVRCGGGGKGALTVVPGSVHASGERIEWVTDGEPAEIDGGELTDAVKALAAATLLGRYWPKTGGRHEAALAVGGVLARAGFPAENAAAFVGAVADAAGDEEVNNRERDAAAAVRNHGQGGRTYGFPALVKAFGEPVAKRVAEWIDLQPDDPSGRPHESTRRTAEATLAEASNLDGGVVTQDSVARVFARRYAKQLRYDFHARAWFEWTGTHWQRDERERAFQFVRELGRELSDGGKAAVIREVRKVQFAAGAEKLARGDAALAITSEAWDGDPFLFGTPGGTVDLRTGELRAADPADGITKLAAVAPADTADCPRWLQFLDETFGGDEEVITFVQRWAGYCLTGDTREHALVFGSGSGGNGKGVLLNTVAGVLGNYATTASMEVFTASDWDRHPTELARLRGARLVTASETEEGRQWAEARIKQLTGGDVIAARFMRRDFFEFRPAFKLFIIGNHRPSLRNVDDAMRRRLNIVAFNNKPAVPDLGLEEKLRDEWPAILRWMIDGCLVWQGEGLNPPEAIQDTTRDYFAAQDSFGSWLDEACIVQPGNDRLGATTRELFESWSAYARAANEQPGTETSFAVRLTKRGLRKCERVPTTTRGRRTRGFYGIKLLAENTEPQGV